MENWIAANWFSILTLLIVGGGWVYGMGKLNQKVDSLAQDQVDTQTELGAAIAHFNRHDSDHSRHVTAGFMQMCNDRHEAILRDVASVKSGVTRIENILLERMDK